MKEIVEAHRKWKRAKALAESRCREKGLVTIADRLSQCHMFNGTETLDELAKLLFSAKGCEFATRFGFPDMETLRKFSEYDPERYGAYIDKGEEFIEEQKDILLAGDTTAEIVCSHTVLYRIILLHGAKAHVRARAFSVVKIERDASSSYDVDVEDFAKVLE